MSDMAITNLQNAQLAPGQAPVNNGTALGKEQFMQLLMAQLKAQDPLNPMDSTAFVAQLSQFASLEQETNIGKKLDDLVTITGANNSANSVSLLGKEVRLQGNAIAGPCTFYYELGQPASALSIEVRDSTGHVVKSYEGQSGTTGLHTLQIEGIEKGDYRVVVKAKNQAGQDMPVGLSIGDTVTGVNFAGNVPNLILASGGTMPASQIIEVRTRAGS